VLAAVRLVERLLLLLALKMPAERTQLSPSVAFKVAAAVFFWPQLKQATVM
jgi:hypothetical protein